MPLRFLRPGLTTSACWNSASWQAQSFYVRLITLADDYGRYDGRWQILRSHAFPLHEEITCKQMLALCEQLQTHGLADFYRTPDGKEVVELTKWKERPRSESRFPAKNDFCEQMFANVVKCSLPTPSPSPSPSPSPYAQQELSGFADFYGLYPRKVARGEAEKAWKALKPDDALKARIITAIRAQRENPEWSRDGGKFIPHPATWLRARRWEDEAAPDTEEARKNAAWAAGMKF